jgi:uncharacterized protein YbaR (Trm112 family)
LKPWLLNILACPIDKHHPLEAIFFRWETPDAELAKTAAEAGKPANDLQEKYRVLQKQLGDGTISPPSLLAITDLSGNESTGDLLKKALKILKGKTGEPKDLDSLYRYLSTLEVAEGLLFCPKCGRWYPVGCSVESTPELMPDELREREKELEWLSKWRSLAPPSVVRDGKPFSL